MISAETEAVSTRRCDKIILFGIDFIGMTQKPMKYFNTSGIYKQQVMRTQYIHRVLRQQC